MHPLHHTTSPFPPEVFSDPAVSPELFYRSRSDGTCKTRGEFALMCAVLDDALVCFQKQFSTKARRVQRLAREAEKWLFTDDPSWPFSFVNLCHMLGLDPGHIRQGLKERYLRAPTLAPPKRRRRTVIGRRLPLHLVGEHYYAVDNGHRG